MNADKRRSAFIRVNPRYGFMVSCLCPYQDYRDYRAPVSAVVVSAAVASASAVDVRVSVVAAVEPAVLAPVVLAQLHVHLALALADARSASVVHVAAVAAVAVFAAVAQRVVLHAAPDRDFLAARQAVAVVEPQPFHDARHAPGTSVPSHDPAPYSRGSP